MNCGIGQSVDRMINGETESVARNHKEEGKSRMQSDAADRNGLKETISSVTHPLNPEGHPNSPVNIVTGKISPATVNVDQSLDIGKAQTGAFEDSLPDGFYAHIRKKVITMTASNESVQIWDQKVFDTIVIYT